MLGQVRNWRKRLTQSRTSRRNRLRDAIGFTDASRRGLRAGFEQLEPRVLLAAITPPPGLIGWWSGDGNADDVAGQNDGTMFGGVTFQQGMVGQAFRFDGSDDWISANQTFVADQSHTIEAWVNWNGSGQFLQEVVSWWNTSDAVANRMFLGTAGTGIRYGDGWTNTGVTLPANRWVHIAATYDGASNARRLFLDGQQLASIGNSAEARFSSFLAIGRQGNGQTAGEYWNGLIDELSIYDRALDASEIAAIFGAGTDGKLKPSPAVFWDGGAGTLNWQDALNWSTDVVPGANDDVVLNVPENELTVTLAGNTTVNSLHSEEALEVLGGSLTVTGPSFVNRRLVLSPGTTLTAAGDAATFTGTDATSADGANLIASSGGILSLPNLTTYAHAGTGGITRTLSASGAGSRLELGGLTQITGPTDHASFVSLRATGGGKLDLSAVTRIEVPVGVNPLRRGVSVFAENADSAINLSSLTDWLDHGFTSGSSIEIRDGGSVSAESLANAVGLSLFVSHGLTLSLPALAAYDTGTANTTITWDWRASGAGSTLDLPSLTTLVGPSNHTLFLNVHALDGGTVNLPSLSQITVPVGINPLKRGVAVLADGIGSTVSMPLLTDWLDHGFTSGSSIEIRDGGSVSAESLANAVGLSLFVSHGLTLSLPALAAYDTGTANTTITWDWRASGAGSTLDLPSLTTLVGPSNHTLFLNVHALDGGTVNLPSLSQITVPVGINPLKRGVAVLADGIGSTVSMPLLTDWLDHGFTSGSSIAVRDGGSVSAESLANAVGLSLFVSHGLTLSLPALAAYDTGTANTTITWDWRASGAGSTLDLPSLTTLVGPSNHTLFLNVHALDGGTVNLPSLSQITVPVGINPLSRGVALLAESVGSTIQLPSLVSIDDVSVAPGSRLEVRGGGRIDLNPLGTSVSAVDVIAGTAGEISVGTLTIAAGSTLSGGGMVLGNVSNEGEVGPGASADALAITGDYLQGASGSLNIEIGGLVAGTGHDQLNVSGALTLDGTLNVALTNGFSPADGNVFEVLTFGSRTGDFATKNGLQLPGNSAFAAIFGSDNLLLQTVGDDPPVIASLTAAPASVYQGAEVTLTAVGVSDPNNNVSAVRFYWDANNNGTLEPETDQLLGADQDGSDGWSVTEPLVLALGVQAILARAEDTTNNSSNVVVTSIQVDPSVYWDGDAGDFQWSNPLNWSGDTLPGPADDVVIDVADEITVIHSTGNDLIRSLHSGESFNLAGGTLTVAANSKVTGDFSTGTNASLVASGSQAVFTASGVVALGASNLLATNGGMIDLPTAGTYASPGDGGTSLKAIGTDSRLLLNGMTSLTGYGRHGQLIIEARSGGLVDLSSLTNIPLGTTQVQAFGDDSVVDVSNLTTWTDNNRQRSSFVTWGLGGVVRVDALQSLTSVGIIANTGDVLSFPSLTYIGGIGDSSATLLADGAGSRIDLPMVLAMDGPDRHGQLDLQARNGGVIDIPALTENLNGTTQVTAFGSGSRINVSGLQTWTDNNRQRSSLLSWGDGGVVEVDSLVTLNSVSVTASNGNLLSFPALQRIGGVGDSAAVVLAQGTGSRLEFPSVTVADGPERHGSVTFQALSGGVVDLPVLAQIEHGSVNVSAFDSDLMGAGSRVDMPSLITWNNNNDNRESWIRYGRNGVADLSALRTLIGVSIYASDGDTVRLPALQAYDRGFNVQSTIQATGASSRIELPVATSIQGSTNRGGVWVRALDGATISMPNATSITGGPTNITISGAGSRLEVDALQEWSIGGTQWIPNGLLIANGGVAMTAESVSIQSLPVEVRTGGILIAPMLELLSGATLSGDGIIDGSVSNTAGFVRPGSAIGALRITGDFANSAVGVVALQLGGAGAGTGHDQLLVTGRATLDGTLDVSLVNGFTPIGGDAFEILRFASRFCDFQMKTGLDLGGGLYLAAAFDADSMSLHAGGTPDSGQQCQIVPALTNVDVGPDPAKAGDAISITFEVDVPLSNTPEVTINGNAATLSAQNGSLYTFAYIVQGNETEGHVDVEIVATSLDGGIGREILTTELDFTDPIVTDITPDHDPADIGTALTITFIPSEPLSASTEVRIGGQPATRNNVPGYSYTRLLTGDEGLGQVPVEIAAVDLAGNTSTTSDQILIVSGGLDANVTGTHLTDDRPSVGQTVTATAEIHNSGLYDIANVPIRLSLIEPSGGERLLKLVTIPSIPAGGSVVVAADLDLETDGVHVFRLQIDPDNIIPEIVESDNAATRSIIVDSAVETVMELTGALSQASVPPGTPILMTGTASWLANLNPAGPVAGGLVSLSVPGTVIAGATFSGSDGAFSLAIDSPLLPGDYVANLTVSDMTTESLLVLPFTVTAPPAGVDLFTNDARVLASDLTPVAGTPVTLSARIFNVGGDDFVGATEVRFYDGATLISTEPISGIASQASSIVSFSHVFASPGTHWVTAVVDADNLVTENSELNNAGVVQLTVLDTEPDLSPTDILFSDTTPATTDTVTLTAAINNSGGAAATNVIVRFFDQGVPVGVAVIPSIAADGGVEFTSIHAVLPFAGQRQISVTVDPDNTILETDESNNTRDEIIHVHAPAPDLVASVIVLSNNTPVAGDSVDITMTVRNEGESDADGFDARFTKDGTVLGTVRVPGLAANAVVVISLPTSFSTVGLHSVGIVLDSALEIAELSETNNASSKSLQVLATPLPDLTIAGSEITLSDSNPIAGQVVTVTVPVRNMGRAASQGVTAELQIDGNVVGSASAAPADIASGASAIWELDFVAPAGDGFHLLEIVVDKSNVIGESNENNNRDFVQFLVGDHPDLVPSDVDFSNPSPISGDEVMISATISNDGDAAVGEFLVRFLDGSQQIGQATISGLAVGASKVVNVPFDTAGRSGNRLIQVVADPGNFVTEANEGNNLVSRLLLVSSADAVAPTTVAAPSVSANAAGWNNTDVDIELTATDNAGGSGVAFLRYAVDGGPLQTILDATHTVSLTAEGVHTIAYQAVDFAQNAEALRMLTVRIDKTAPTPLHAGPFTVAEGSSITLVGTASFDALSGIARTAWALDGDDLFDDGDPAIYAGTDGPITHDVLLRGVDAAGNQAVVTAEVQVTNVAPTFEAGPDESLLPPQAGAFLRPSIEFNDPGTDVWSGTVNYGDGSGDLPLAIDQAAKRFELGHTYTTEGAFTITITLQDDDLATSTDTFGVEVTLNSPPVAQDDHATTDEDTPIAFDVLVNDTDADGNLDPTTVMILSAPSNGGVTVDPASGEINYLPDPNFNGSDSFVYQVCDSEGLCDTATVDVTVDAVNDAPLNRVPAAQSVEEETSLSISGLSVADTDVDETPAPNNTIQVNLSVNSGALQLASVAGLTGDFDGIDGVLSITGTIADVNAALATLTYQGNLDFSGDDVLTINTNDLGHSGSGAIQGDVDVVDIQVKNLVDIAGRVFDDLDNDGIYEPADGDAGLPSVAIQVWDLAMTTLLGSTATSADGTYSLNANLGAGTYKIVQVADELSDYGLLDGKETAGSIGGLVRNDQDSNEVSGIEVGDPGTTADAVDYLFAEVRTSDLFGRAWRDFNNDGQIDFGEAGIDGVAITLSGTDDRGILVDSTDWTVSDGSYAFINLRPGVYAIQEVQPAGYDDGLESLGEVTDPGVSSAVSDRGAIDGNDRFAGIHLVPGSEGDRYNFGDRPQADGAIGGGMTAGIGFWHNKNGQDLISSLNGGPDATNLGDWLAATFPNMYGAGAFYDSAEGEDQDMNLAGATNAEISEVFKFLHKRNKKTAVAGGPPKLDAQTLATALSTYATSLSLAGSNVAADFGFTTSGNGIAYSTFDVLSALTEGEAAELGLTPGTDGMVTVIDILLATNSRASSGLLYDADANESIGSGELRLRELANRLLSAINDRGGI